MRVGLRSGVWLTWDGGGRSLCPDSYGSQDSFLHFLHFCFHAVFKDGHKVDQVFYDDGSVEVLLGEARAFWGCPLVFQELTQTDGRGGF